MSSTGADDFVSAEMDADEIEVKAESVNGVSEDPKTNGGQQGYHPDMVDLDFVDHFSLRQPSSTVGAFSRRQRRQVRVYNLVNDQLQLEHKLLLDDPENANTADSEEGDDNDGNHETKTSKLTLQVTMQRLRRGSMGLRLLRGFYTLIALLMFGFIFVFAAQVVSFQAMEIPRYYGEGEPGTTIYVNRLVAVIFSLPLLAYSMASLLALAMVFVSDCWNGHVLFALLFSGFQPHAELQRVPVEWFCFVMYIVIPVITMIVTMFMGRSDWSEIGALTWYASMNLSFFIFCAMVFYHEMKLGLEFTHFVHDPEGTGPLIRLMPKAVLMTLMQRYRAVEELNYVVQNGSTKVDTDNYQSVKTIAKGNSMSLFGRIKMISGNPFFEHLDPPIRRYSVEELRETVPIESNHSWSLERACCRLRLGRNRFVISGPNALEPRQYRSTLAVNAIGFLLSVTLLVAFLYQMGQGTFLLILVTVLLLFLVGLPLATSAVQLRSAMPRESPKTTDDSDQEDDENEPAFYQEWAAFTVAKPKEWYCWMRLGVEVIMFFIFPTISMYAAGNLTKSATVFWGTGIFSIFRLYLDAGSIINGYGTLSSIKFSGDPEDGKTIRERNKPRDMVARARASEIIGKISTATRVYLFMIFFGVLGAYYAFSASNTQNGENATPESGRPPIRLLDDFYYPPLPNTISYPACKLDKDFAIPGQNFTYMMDYNIMAALGYETYNVSQYILNKWFGEEAGWLDETQFVNQWRAESGNAKSHASFKLFSKTSQPGVGVLSIRGTETPTDRLLNSQLYMGTALTTFVRALMPFNWLWGNVYEDLLATTSWIASDHLLQSAYYKVTSNFANDMLNNQYEFDGKTYNFNFLRTTGVSLGGGLALITGAQTEAYAVSISGINPTLARLTFDPPLSIDALNTHVFNVIPDNDPISALGDAVRNHQRVDCRTWPAERQSCHSFWRVMCEFFYSCGSPPDRPVLCVCAETWGYPEPIAKGNRTFAQACKEEEASVRQYMEPE
ncbi:Lipase (class 3) [Seminavis robusta]|uniref:Lipase (Class 3) n=1 Tax=Seminavis robusta TaxID=568900 RepID=A0A9N8EMJ8_9STRA|nr:Lipase (class 3) [Seminavis robusta]|eukprot:Sro1265_g257490.1 Lipase (class 3) (1010) ;mRNA; r:22178-25545